MNRYTLKVIILAVAGLAACSPTESKLEAFGKASESAVSLVAIPAQVSVTTLAESELNRNQCRYIRGNSYKLGAPSSQKPTKLVLEQADVAQKLAEYSKALAGALSAEEEKALIDGGASLATAIGEVATSAGASTKAPEVIKFLANAILRIDANRRLQDIKFEMSNVLPYLIVLKRLLQGDAETVDKEMGDRIAEWERHAKCVLSATHRNDPGTRALFLEFDKAKRKLEADRRNARKAADAITKLIEAHYAVIDDEGTLEQGLAILNGFLDQIEAISDT
jgi:hypothetical protein